MACKLLGGLHFKHWWYDITARAAWYKDDWIEGTKWGHRILAPAVFIFLASILPALAFGQQLAQETNGQLTVVQVVAATAISGTIQAVAGGQPLLIVGVAEPIVIIYGYMYTFAEGQALLGADLFLPWATWVCIWAAVMVALLAVLGTAKLINHFTRFSGELFGMLIAILFLQEAIKGMIQEFQTAGVSHTQDSDANSYPWRLVNGLWGLLLTFGLLLSTLLSQTARSWPLFSPVLRGFIADYGAALLVVAWSGLSFAVQGTPKGIPRRVSTDNTWGVSPSWSVASRLGEVPGPYIAGALVPAIAIAVLFYFDHSVSSKMAQLQEFGLIKPSAYHWDLLLLALMTLTCGLIGVPPVNGVLPQAPMHTRSLQAMAKLHGPALKEKEEDSSGTMRSPRRLFAAARWFNIVNTFAGLTKRRSSRRMSFHSRPSHGIGWGNGSIHGSIDLASHRSGSLCNGQLDGLGNTAVLHHNNCAYNNHGRPSQRCSSLRLEAVADGAGATAADATATDGPFLFNDNGAVEQYKVEIRKVPEQRMTNLLQSLAIAACLAITPAIKQIPEAVLWGYFAFMAIASLPGNQFWDRLVAVASDPFAIFSRKESPWYPPGMEPADTSSSAGDVTEAAAAPASAAPAALAAPGSMQQHQQQQQLEGSSQALQPGGFSAQHPSRAATSPAALSNPIVVMGGPTASEGYAMHSGASQAGLSIVYQASQAALPPAAPPAPAVPAPAALVGQAPAPASAGATPAHPVSAQQMHAAPPALASQQQLLRQQPVSTAATQQERVSTLPLPPQQEQPPQQQQQQDGPEQALPYLSFRAMAAFTLFQLVYVMGVWALTAWAGVGGVAFPVAIMLLVPIRMFLLPRVFTKEQLTLLDPPKDPDEVPALEEQQQEPEQQHQEQH